MIHKILLIGALSLLCIRAGSAAPTLQDHSPRLHDYLGGRSGVSLSLLDPSRMTVSHNIQMGYSSFSGGSMMQSLYATTIGYRLSDPLSLSITLGLTNNRFSAGGSPTTFNSLVGGARLDYNPTQDIHLRLQFSRAPGFYQSYWHEDPLGYSSGFGAFEFGASQTR